VDSHVIADCNEGMEGRTRKVLARRLRLLRLLRRWSQEDLAAASGLHRTYISLLERAACNITLDNLERLARALGVGVADLLAGKAFGPATRPRLRKVAALESLDKTAARADRRADHAQPGTVAAAAAVKKRNSEPC
jgi:transcriptional regulator with XRE-family HTH domain